MNLKDLTMKSITIQPKKKGSATRVPQLQNPGLSLSLSLSCQSHSHRIHFTQSSCYSHYIIIIIIIIILDKKKQYNTPNSWLDLKEKKTKSWQEVGQRGRVLLLTLTKEVEEQRKKKKKGRWKVEEKEDYWICVDPSEFSLRISVPFEWIQLIWRRKKKWSNSILKMSINLGNYYFIIISFVNYVLYLIIFYLINY